LSKIKGELVMSLRDAMFYSSIVAYTGNLKITELASKEVSIPWQE